MYCKAQQCFHFQPEVKKSDGSILTVSDISDDMLFGNGLTYGSILLKDGSSVGSTFIVTDQNLDPIIESHLSEVKARLSG